MTQQDIQIALVFAPDDQAWIRRTAVEVPQFWLGHSVAPMVGDVIRVGGRQFAIEARVWEHDGVSPMLRLFVGSSHARSDTTFG
jgi:hypothetical protein